MAGKQSIVDKRVMMIRKWRTGPMGIVRCVLLACWLAVCLASRAGWGAEYRVRPGDDPQAAIDRAEPGDRVVLLPGLHERPLGRHRAMLYVDKPIEIELAAGATLKLADGQTALQPDGEITTDHSRKTIDDLEVGGRYDLSRGPLLLTIKIDSSGKAEQPDTFSWAYGVFGQPQQQRVPITGDWQRLAHGIEVRFRRRQGHNTGAFWFVSYDGPASYGIRVGHGTQPSYIENVRIVGRGTIDLNRTGNVQPSPMVKDISACVLVHGRVRNVHIEGITMTNTMRSVMIYGEHTGRFLPGGGVEGGESFDAERITIVSTRTINPGGSAYLLGHPSHRGRLRQVRCNFNTMLSQKTSLEPNFNLDGYEVIGNLIQSDGLAVHCWRRSTNGVIADNVRLEDDRGRGVVVNNAPSGWKASENLTFSGNLNLRSDRLPGEFAASAATMEGHYRLEGRTNDAAFHVLQPGDGRGIELPDERAVYRLTRLGRSWDGRAYAAFSARGEVRSGGEGPAIAEDWVWPASRSSREIEMRVRLSSDQKRLVLEVRGQPGKEMVWVGRLELRPLDE